MLTVQFIDLLRASRNRPALVRSRCLNVLSILTKVPSNCSYINSRSIPRVALDSEMILCFYTRSKSGCWNRQNSGIRARCLKQPSCYLWLVPRLGRLNHAQPPERKALVLRSDPALPMSSATVWRGTDRPLRYVIETATVSPAVKHRKKLIFV
jgi:hypothetical protein